MNKKIGIIDLGSNTVRLVVYEINNYCSYKLIDEIKQSVRLIENMVDGKYINDFSMHKSIKTVKLFRKLCLSYKIPSQNITAITTAAIRNAENKNQLLEMLNKSTGLDFKTLEEDEEAFFIHNGVKYTIDSNNNLIINIGGGSIQIIHSLNNCIQYSINIPIGSISATEKYLNYKNYALLKSAIIHELSKNNWIKSAGNVQIIGVGGFIRTLSKMIMHKNSYPLNQIHNYDINTVDIYKTYDEISDLDLNSIKKLTGMSLYRADIFIGGLFILKTILEYLNSVKITISGCGLREGILFNYLFSNSAIKFTDVLNFSVNNYINNFKLNNVNTNNVIDLSMSLFNQLKPLHMLGLHEEKLLHYSALLHNVGLLMGYHGHCDHTFYMLLNSNIYGLTHREIVLLSAISASYKNSNNEIKYITSFTSLLSQNDIRIYRILTLFLKLSERFDKSKIRIIESIDCKICDNSVKIKTIHNGDAELEISLANDISDEFFSIFSKKLIIT